MKPAARRRWIGFLSAVALMTLLGASPRAFAANPFDYKLEVTPEEGPIDPAIDERYTPEWAGCQKRARTTSDNAACFEAEFRRQDSQLNKTWRATLKRLPSTLHKSLLMVQRQWVADRDPFCRKDADGFAGGTIEPVIYVDCLVELTIRRTIWLEHLR